MRRVIISSPSATIWQSACVFANKLSKKSFFFSDAYSAITSLAILSFLSSTVSVYSLTPSTSKNGSSSRTFFLFCRIYFVLRSFKFSSPSKVPWESDDLISSSSLYLLILSSFSFIFLEVACPIIAPFFLITGYVLNDFLVSLSLFDLRTILTYYLILIQQ